MLMSGPSPSRRGTGSATRRFRVAARFGLTLTSPSVFSRTPDYHRGVPFCTRNRVAGSSGCPYERNAVLRELWLWKVGVAVGCGIRRATHTQLIAFPSWHFALPLSIASWRMFVAEFAAAMDD